MSQDSSTQDEKLAIGSRLASERQRLGLTQDDLARLQTISPRTQASYEQGIYACDALYLQSAIRSGIDIMFVLTGSRMASLSDSEVIDLIAPPALPAAFQRVLSQPEQVKTGIIRMLEGVLNIIDYQGKA